MTGKGDRWGRDRLGRSEPAFLRASTTALPPLTCTARREVQDVVSSCCLLQGRPTVGRLFFKACAGRRIRRLCLPAVPVLQAVFCLPCQLCLPCPLPSSVLAPVHLLQVCFAPVHFKCHFCFVCPCSLPCAPGSVLGPAICFKFQYQHVCKLQDCPVGSCNTGLQWRPVHRFIFDLTLFPAESMILGHGLV